MKVKEHLRLCITITIGLLLLALCFVLMGWRIKGFMMENKCYKSGNTSDINLDLMDGVEIFSKETYELSFFTLKVG